MAESEVLLEKRILAEPVDPALMDPPAVRRRRRPTIGSLVSMVWLVLVIGSALLAPLLPIRDPNSSDFAAISKPVFTAGHLLGTDQLGRDLLSRLIFGARISLLVGILAVLIAAVIGGLLGLAAGYLRGWLDTVVTIGCDALMAFPSIVLIIVLVAILGPSLTSLIIGLTTVFLPSFLRLARGAAISLAPRDYVIAARASGASDVRILRREVLPQTTWSLVTYAVIAMANAVVAEGSLSFLGLGLRPPAASWGSIIAGGLDVLETAPWVSLVPALTLCLTVLALQTLGEWLRLRSAPRGSA